MVEVDLLITNGTVLTLDADNKEAKSLGIKAERIVGIWETAEPSAGEVTMLENSKIIDLKGSTVIPGFIDTHNHILDYSLNKDKVDCSSPLNKNIPDILRELKRRQRPRLKASGLKVIVMMILPWKNRDIQQGRS